MILFSNIQRIGGRGHHGQYFSVVVVFYQYSNDHESDAFYPGGGEALSYLDSTAPCVRVMRVL